MGTFGHVCNLERPLASIGNFTDALLLVSEALDEPGGSVVNELAWAIRSRVEELDAEHESLFKLTHPDRERLKLEEA